MLQQGRKQETIGSSMYCAGAQTFIVCRKISFTKACCRSAFPLSNTDKKPDFDAYLAVSCAHCPAVVAPSFLKTSHCRFKTQV